MRTKTLLSTATPQTAQAAIDTAVQRGWKPETILRFANEAVKAQLGQATSATTAVAPRAPKAKRKQPKPNTRQARPVSFTADFASYRGGKVTQELVTGQYPIVGARKAVYGLFTTESGRSFRLSQAAFTKLTELKQRVMVFVNGKSAYITLA